MSASKPHPQLMIQQHLTPEHNNPGCVIRYINLVHAASLRLHVLFTSKHFPGKWPIQQAIFDLETLLADTLTNLNTHGWDCPCNKTPYVPAFPFNSKNQCVTECMMITSSTMYVLATQFFRAALGRTAHREETIPFTRKKLREAVDGWKHAHELWRKSEDDQVANIMCELWNPN